MKKAFYEDKTERKKKKKRWLINYEVGPLSYVNHKNQQSIFPLQMMCSCRNLKKKKKKGGGGGLGGFAVYVHLFMDIHETVLHAECYPALGKPSGCSRGRKTTTEHISWWRSFVMKGLFSLWGGGGGGGGGGGEELISILYQETKGKICISGWKYRKKCLDSLVKYKHCWLFLHCNDFDKGKTKQMLDFKRLWYNRKIKRKR